MPTTKRRINISVSDEVYEALRRLSRAHGKAVAGVSLSLIEESLEFAEDRYFSRIADERLIRPQKRVAHKDVWD